MAKKKTVVRAARKPPDKPSGPCVYEGCKTICDDMNYCYGCKSFICEKHCTNPDVSWGSHDVSEHWDEGEDEIN